MKAIPQKRRKLAFIEWQDASGPATARWDHVDEWEHDSYMCYSVGWILAKGADYISLVPHFGHVNEPSNEQMTGMMQIPRKMVKRVVYLKNPAKWGTE